MSRTSPITCRTSWRRLLERLGERLAVLVGLGHAVELEGEVGERLADAVVEVAGDAGALLVGADGAQPGEPAGVVDGEAGRLDEAGEQLDVAVGEVVAARSCSSTSMPTIDSRAGRIAYMPERLAGRRPAPSRTSGTLTSRRSSSAARIVFGSSKSSMRSGGRVPCQRTTSQPPPESSWSSSTAAVEAEQVADPLHRRVEHLVEVERGRQALGDPVEREQQGVGVGQAAQPVEGERVLPVGLAGDPAGVAGDEGDEQELARPLDARAQVVDAVALAGQIGDRHRERRDRTDAHREAEAAGEPGDHDRGEQREDERRVPVAGGHDREHVDARPRR